MNYFVVMNDMLVCFYRGADKSIYSRIYQNGKWSRAVCVISDARARYSVVNEDNLSIICQETAGNIVLCEKKDSGFENNVILEGRGMSPPDMRMIKNGDMILYNLPNGREQTLVLQMQKNGRWERSVMIDGFIPFNDCVFRTARLSGDRLLLVYRKNTSKQLLGFRIADKNGNIGDFKTIYAASGIVTDCSFAEHNGYIHFVFTVKGRLSARLVYVLAAQQAAENGGTVLWEGNNIECASICVQNDRLIVNHCAGNRLYTFISGENGFKGSDMKRTAGAMKKAYVLNAVGINDIIVPRDRPYDIDISVFEK